MFAFYSKILRSVSVCLLALFLTIGATQAKEMKLSPVAVLELFTSQGCTACPAADRLLKKLDKRQDVITLAYHVDYWDYIGWEDSFALPENSARQRSYARSLKLNHIYTPQMIINGVYDVVGSRKGEIEKIIKSTHLSIPILLKYDDQYLEIAIEPNSDVSSALIWLICFSDNQEVEITQGENKGKKLTYSNIVNSRRALSMYYPQEGVNIKLPIKELMEKNDDGFVIILQEDNDGLPGRILGAASFLR